MIHNVRGVVLWSRRSREADKVVGLFTREMGRVTARATSAARAAAKFSALTEPFVESDIALYLVPGRGWGKIVGGRMVSSFPALRTEVARSTAASWICEVIHRLTPEEQASAEKFALLHETLSALSSARSLGTIRLAFAVRFLAAAGFGLDHRDAWRDLVDRRPAWARALLSAPLSELGEEPWKDPLLTAVEHLAGSVVTDHLNRPLHVNRFRQMAGIEI
jgi:recombinational DNA repair protein (RecF pathway)